MPKAKSPPRMLTREQERLVERWMPLARSMVAKCEGGDKAEQLSKAMWGLKKAAQAFDPQRRYTFQALATRAIATGLIDCHRAQKRHAGNVELEEHHMGQAPEDELLPPAKAWTPPPDPQERRIRAPGLSSRSIRRRAKEQGWARPRGRGRALDGQALLRVLQPNPRISTAQLARALGLHRRTLSRGKNGQLLARMRELARVRIFDHDETRNRTAAQGEGPRAASAPRWR